MSAWTPEEAESAAGRIGVTLPAECIPGVAQNLALLDEHWTNLRGFVPPEA